MPRSVPFALLLPPSEGKAEGGGGPRWSTDAGRFGEALGSARAAIVEALAAADGGSPRLLGVGGRHLERARAANAVAHRRAHAPGRSPVHGRGLGPSRTGDAPGRRPPSSRRLGRRALRPPRRRRLDDPVPDYRLKMGASLPPLGVLSRWWRPTLSDVA